MMAHHVGRFKGWGMTAAFLAALVVLGLETRVAGGRWLKPAVAGPVHALGTALLTAVLMWQTRSRKWWHGILCAVLAAGLTSLGELGQRYFSTVRQPHWADVAWDSVGAAAALGVFLLIRIAARIEQLFAARPRIPYEKYHTWQAP